MRTDKRTVPAITPLAVGMIGVPDEAELELRFRLEAVMDGVLVTGSVEAPVEGECARCLDPVADTVTAEFQELYRYPSDDGPGAGSDGADEGEDGDDAEEDYYIEGDVIDLEPVVRDAVVLALPLSPLCGEECPGLCVECGARLADVEADHHHDEGIDPRWEALRKLGHNLSEE